MMNGGVGSSVVLTTTQLNLLISLDRFGAFLRGTMKTIYGRSFVVGMYLMTGDEGSSL